MKKRSPPCIGDARGNYVFLRKTNPDEILELAAYILERRMRKGDVLQNPVDTKRYLSFQIGSLEQETFCCLFLDNRHRVISFERLFNGTIDGATVHPREVVKSALKYNAAAIIFAHNHPSGVVEPSKAGELLTRKLKDALALVDIRVLDHIIVAGSDSISLTERGMI